MTASKPKKTISFGITTRCNYNCSFCVLGDIRTLFMDIDAHSIYKILLSQKNRYGYVSFTGGEPTLRADLPKLVSYAKQLGYKIQISTNGRMFAYKDYCRKLIKNGIDKFCISLSAHTVKSYEKITKTKGSFKQVLSGINNLLALNQHVMTNTVICSDNYRFIPAIAKLLVRLGHRDCRFTFPINANIDSCLSKRKNHFNLKHHNIPQIIKSLKYAIDIMTANSISPRVAVLPFCQLSGYESYIEPFNDDTALYLTTGKNPRLLDMCEKVRFWKNYTCLNCKFNAICAGIERGSPFIPKKIKQ